MTIDNMTLGKENIIQALRTCCSKEDCRDCEFIESDREERSCVDILFHESADLIESMAAELEQAKYERDAAVNELSYLRKCCNCQKHSSEGGNCYGNHACGNGNPDWEWRGPCAENGGTE